MLDLHTLTNAFLICFPPVISKTYETKSKSIKRTSKKTFHHKRNNTIKNQFFLWSYSSLISCSTRRTFVITRKRTHNKQTIETLGW